MFVSDAWDNQSYFVCIAGDGRGGFEDNFAVICDNLQQFIAGSITASTLLQEMRNLTAACPVETFLPRELVGSI
jgi:hypothetical protein